MQTTERTYSTSYGTVHYWISRCAKERPWLVFLPGLTADHRLFDKQMEHFGDSWNCLTWDAPAHGRSRPFELKFSLLDMAAYLHGILKTERIDRPILVGQSLGGYLAQVYMAQYPETAAGFVSVDSCSLSRKYFMDWELRFLKHTKGMYMSIPWKMLIWWGSNGVATTAYGRELMKRMMCDYEKEEYCCLADHGYRIVAEAVEARPAYPISCPVLLICGEKDGAGSAKRYNRSWEKRDGYQVMWIPRAGHNSNTDAPEAVNQLIEQFGSRIFLPAL